MYLRPELPEIIKYLGQFINSNIYSIFVLTNICLCVNINISTNRTYVLNGGFNMSKSRRVDLRIVIYLSIILLSIIILLGIIRNVTASAAHDDSRQLTCTSHYISDSDTLWSIANEYYTDEYDSIQEYVEVIKRTNNLTSDVIYKGAYLIIPYYI